MKRSKKISILVIAVVVVTAAFLIFRPGTSKNSYELITEKPKTGDISKTVITTGTVQPVNTVSVGSQVSGTIKKLYVDYNSVVKEGQLLAELDKTLFEASYNQAKSNYDQVNSQLLYQRGNFERQNQLYKVGAISKADYENALYTYESYKAQVASAEAQVQSARKNLSLASIFSPIDGTVLSRSVSEGQTVAASFNTPTIFGIAKDLKEMQVEASVDEADIGGIVEGDSASFTVDAFPNDVFLGVLQQVRLNPTTTNNVVTYTTIIKASNENLKLKPGMTANITIYTQRVKNAMLIPVKALKISIDSVAKYFTVTSSGRPVSDNEVMVIVKQDKQIVQKAIKTGLNNNVQVEVTAGLTANDEVVTTMSQTGTSETIKSTDSNSSPFLPKRPVNSRSKAK